MEVAAPTLAPDRFHNSSSPDAAVIEAGLHEVDRAFDRLDKSIDDRSLRYNIMEPAFEEPSRDPRFDRVRNRLGIQTR
jgi:hypothetical protein